jgi:peroxiredoxin
MSGSENVYELPKNLPVPIDDGACDHLTGLQLPSVPLMTTAGSSVDLTQLPGIIVVYCYPRTGRPDQDIPAGWDLIPGARGCTPESCAFRDHYQELRQAGAAQVFGLSTQTSTYQQEAVSRLHLPFAILSDAELAFTQALHLPTFVVAGMILIKRLTLIIADGRVIKVFYPVFPPDQHAAEVLAWLSEHPQAGEEGQRRVD